MLYRGDFSQEYYLTIQQVYECEMKKNKDEEQVYGALVQQFGAKRAEEHRKRNESVRRWILENFEYF